jgi:hypothetical protein
MARGGRSQWITTRRSVPDSAPTLARAAVKLAYRGVLSVTREAREALRLRIELEYRVGGDVADPRFVVVIDADRISMRGVAWQLVNLPALRGRIVDAEIARVPFAHP